MWDLSFWKCIYKLNKNTFRTTKLLIILLRPYYNCLIFWGDFPNHLPELPIPSICRVAFANLRSSKSSDPPTMPIFTHTPCGRVSVLIPLLTSRNLQEFTSCWSAYSYPWPYYYLVFSINAHSVVFNSVWDCLFLDKFNYKMQLLSGPVNWRDWSWVFGCQSNRYLEHSGKMKMKMHYFKWADV